MRQQETWGAAGDRPVLLLGPCKTLDCEPGGTQAVGKPQFTKLFNKI